MKLHPDFLSWPETKTLTKAFGGEVGKLRFVGGAVRDAVLGIAASDVDAATIFTPQETLELLEKAAIRPIPTGIKHGTITALIDGKAFEITTLRRDTSCDGRHAAVEFTSDWQEDAARRDFTMNALYLSADGELFDYHGGAEDARNGVVRFIGNAYDRIQEDYLRILRFFRFYAYYGKTEPDADALSACKEFAGKITTLSGERIQQEMLKLLAAPKAFTTLELMQPDILKEVCGFICHPRFMLGAKEINIAILLLSATIDPVAALDILATRWRLSGDLRKYLFTVITNVNFISTNLPLARQKHLIRKLGNGIFTAIVLLKQGLQPEENYSAMLELAKHWQPPLFPVSGKDLIRLGIAEGKELGEKLHRLEIIWEESDYTMTREELLKY